MKLLLYNSIFSGTLQMINVRNLEVDKFLQRYNPGKLCSISMILLKD